jgi:hypothetical protein
MSSQTSFKAICAVAPFSCMAAPKSRKKRLSHSDKVTPPSWIAAKRVF